MHYQSRHILFDDCLGVPKRRIATREIGDSDMNASSRKALEVALPYFEYAD